MIESTVSGGVGVLRLSAPPLNTITFPLLDELRAALRRANVDPEVRGIVLTGRPDHFSAGADVGLFRDIARADEAVRTSRLFQDAFQAVEDSAKPVVAAVAGRVMGSALELAMACHYRVCAATARFSMPEVTLGINPGAGGTQRLPRLIGAEEGLKMLLTGQAIDAPQARALGLVDAVCEGGDLLESARTVLRSAPGPRRTGQCTGKVSDAAANEAAFQRARQRLAGARPEIIAPWKILEAVRAGLEDSFQAGLRKEQEGFAECMATPGARNRIYLFFATREAGKILGSAAKAAAPITKAAVIGMGSMGTGIAQALIAGGIRVAALDQDSAAVQKAVDRIRSSVRGRVERGGLKPEAAEGMLALLSTAAAWREIADAQLVIEAVFEDAAVKRAVIGEIEAVCGGETIIASNTSTISLDVLAAGMRRPARLIGMHFFNPAHRMPLVEIIRRDETPETVVAAALGFAKAIRKTPVLVRNREGFLVNRLFIPYLKEAFWLLEEGADAPEIDNAMVAFGFPMGPLTLIDMAGLDVLVLTDRVLSRAFPAHGPLSKIAVRLVERGRLGQKTGSGVYRYEKGDRTPLPSAEAAQIIAEVRVAQMMATGHPEGRAPRRVGKDEITRRLILRMVNEAFYVMEEGIAERESDLDVALVLGTGFPDFRGGVLKYARDVGLGSVLADLDKLAAEHGARFSPCRYAAGSLAHRGMGNGRSSMMAPPTERKDFAATAKMKEVMGKYFMELMRGREEGRKTAWCTSVGPAELLRALGFNVYFPENHGAMLGATRMATDLIPLANARGFSPDICSYLTSDIGSYLKGESPFHKMKMPGPPKADVLVFNTNQCRDVKDWFQFYAREWNVPCLGIHTPRAIGELDDAILSGVARQTEALVKPLEEVADTKLDPARLKETLELSRRCTLLWKAVLETAANVPSPVTFFDGTIQMGPAVVLRGHPDAIAYYEVLLAELKDRIANGVAAVEGERFRIYWEGMPIWGKLKDLAAQFLALRTCVVASTYCNSWIFEALDPADPFRSMARAYSSLFICRSEDQKEKYLEAMMARFKVNGILYHDSKTCPNNSNNRYRMPQRLQEKTGKPYLVINGDLNDLRLYSEEQARTSIEAFVEQLAQG